MAPRATYGLVEVLRCGTALQAAGAGASSLEELAADVVGRIREAFVDKATGQPALPLVRFYVTSRWADLEPPLKDFALAVGTDARSGSDVRCLALLATAGEEPAWNDRQASRGHKAIPLPSVEALRRLPMVARLVEQLGVDPLHLVEPGPSTLVDHSERTYDVFFVPEARNSPYVPDQDSFVIPYGIRSVVGLGGVSATGELFAVLLFSSVPIPAGTLDAFSAMALSIQVAVLGVGAAPVFAGDSTPLAPREEVGAGARPVASTLARLADLRAAAVEAEAARLEEVAAELSQRRARLDEAEAACTSSDAGRAAIVDGALDAIIGMDGAGRITEFNRAAEDIFRFRRRDVIGQPLADTIIPPSMRERHRVGLAALLATGEGPLLGRRIEVQALRADGTEFPVELAISQVDGAEPATFNGWVRDISERRRAAEELAAGRERLAHIARTLQTSLLPPELPDIDGYELSAAYQALGDGYEVGGDFYDAFEINDGRWAISLGDVCGKGSEAAVVTALTRYTLRAAAMRSSDPAAVLRILNQAVHRQHPDTFCTAACATIEPATGTVRLALGGHPRPLLLSAAGAVTAVGTGGALVGPFERWQGSAVTFRLRPGDLLLLFSDGVTESRSGAEFFGEQRLSAALAGAAGLAAPEVTRLVESAVLGFAGNLSDDLAMLAIRRLGRSA